MTDLEAISSPSTCAHTLCPYVAFCESPGAVCLDLLLFYYPVKQCVQLLLNSQVSVLLDPGSAKHHAHKVITRSAALQLGCSQGAYLFHDPDTKGGPVLAQVSCACISVLQSLMSRLAAGPLSGLSVNTIIGFMLSHTVMCWCIAGTWKRDRESFSSSPKRRTGCLAIQHMSSLLYAARAMSAATRAGLRRFLEPPRSSCFAVRPCEENTFLGVASDPVATGPGQAIVTVTPLHIAPRL